MATPAAVLSDFGGVLTSSVPDAFSKASRLLGGGPDLLSRLFHEDAGAARLLVDHECGRISESEFDAGIRECLRGRGIDAAGARVVSVIQEALTPDERMLGALVALRERGIPVALVTNSLGDDAYRGYDLDALADVVVISGQVGTRKPSRLIYQIACDRLGVGPESALLIDDLQQNLDGAARLGVQGILHRDSHTTIDALTTWFGVLT
ncbi:HAD-IA family hydrolase [Nocardioides sp. AN3]